MRKFLPNIKGDKVIWGVVIILSVFSILAVYSSTTTLAFRFKQGNTEYYFLKHIFIMLFGFGLMYLAHKINYSYYSKISIVAIVIAIPLLFYTLVFGENINEASRWTTIPGINLMFQPSDFAKLALIMFVARMLAVKHDKLKDFKDGYLPIIGGIAFVCGLILPANFSTAALLFATCLVLMFIAGVRIKHIFITLGTGFVLLAIFIAFLMISPHSKGRLGTWQTRIENFGGGGDKDENFQVEQSKIAIANGGAVGKMPGNSTQKNFLPNPFNDFIYSIIIEEYGIIGGGIVLLMYLILLFRGVRIAVKAPGNYGAFLAIGVAFSLVFQAMINMAVAVNLLPVTGQPLPLVSMGGTSIWFTSIALGIILSVSKELENNQAEKVQTANA